MDLLAYALSKNSSGGSGGGSAKPVIPAIGGNGNWFIDGNDTGVRATGSDNVEVDGVLKVDPAAQYIYVEKNGATTIVGECTTSITKEKIDTLFA